MTADDAWTRARWDESWVRAGLWREQWLGAGDCAMFNTWSLQASIVVQTKWPVNS